MKRTLHLSNDPVNHDWNGGAIRIEPRGRVSLNKRGLEYEVNVPDLADSAFVELWLSPRWCVALGLKSRTLIVAVPDSCMLITAGPLSRLSFDGGYDPGGMERVEFHELKSGDSNPLLFSRW